MEPDRRVEQLEDALAGSEELVSQVVNCARVVSGA